MKIYIVRHGQTEWNKSLRWQGNQDVPLDETGVAQAVKLAEKLSSYRLNVGKIYSSPLIRAAATAEILNEKLCADIIFREGLREVRLGEWEGFTTEEITAQHGGKPFREWDENPAAIVGFGVENMVELQRRAYLEFEEIAARETGDFLIVSHGAWIRCLLCKLLDIPLESRWNFEVDNAGISVVYFGKNEKNDKNENPPRFTVITLNEISFQS